MTVLAYSCYKQIIAVKDNIMDIGDTIPIPKFSQEHVQSIINEAKALLSKGKPLIHRSGDYVMVGDIHGSLHDMFRIFSYYGYPPKTKYIFLGDYVDRGEFSIEVITFLLVCYVQFPGCIILLRGNHEFETTNSLYGFKANIEEEYGNDILWKEFNDCFAYFPIACILDSKIICLHGGISSNFTSIEPLKEIQFPIYSDNIIVSDITWSDPSNVPFTYMRNERGLGQVFGIFVFNEFLANSNLSMMIRGHECVDGIKKIFNKKLITVFSASNYGTFKNRSGVLYIKQGKVETKIFDVLERVPKANSYFFPVVRPKCKQCICLKSSRVFIRSMLFKPSEYALNSPMQKSLRSSQIVLSSRF